jgi:glucose dehydrogenase
MTRTATVSVSFFGAAVLGLATLVASPGAQGPTSSASRGGTPTDSWPTYNGDFSGRRFSPLTRVNAGNVHALSLAWV